MMMVWMIFFSHLPMQEFDWSSEYGNSSKNIFEGINSFACDILMALSCDANSRWRQKKNFFRRY